MTVAQDVASAQDALNLFLVLVTIFTSLQASNLATERQRNGGPLRSHLFQVSGIMGALAMCSFISLWSLLPVTQQVIRSHGTQEWSSTFEVYLLSVLLIGALAAWQLVIVVRTCRSFKGSH